MKTKRRSFALFVSVFLIILLSGFVVAIDDCAVGERNACIDAGNYVVFGLSAETNAHAEKAHDGPYPYVLCCNFQGTRECSTTRILGLSSEINAHVSAPDKGYAIPVCYGDLVCRTETGTSCSTDYPIRTVSISSETNAHVARFDIYPIKICCKHATAPPPPGTVMWADSNNQKITTAIEDQTVRLFFNPDQLVEGQEITYEIKEDNGLFPDDHIKSYSYFVTAADVAQGFAYDTWTAKWFDDGYNILEGNRNPEYYFIANIGAETLVSGKLKVSPAAPGGTITLTCESHDDYAEWIYFEDGVETGRINVNLDNCYNENYDKGCCPSGYACNENNDKCEGGVIPKIDRCSDYKDESLNDNGEERCNNDPENVADASVAVLYNGKNCDSGNNIINENPLTYLTKCRCIWEIGTGGTEVCKADVTIIEEVDGVQYYTGRCSAQENTNDDCSDGFLTYSWISSWTWDSRNNKISQSDIPIGREGDYTCISSTECYYDPVQNSGLKLSEDCLAKSGERTVPCAGGITLPFFGFFNILMTIVILIGIYVLIEKRK